VSELERIVQEISDVVRPIDDARVDAFAKGLSSAPRVFVTGEGRSGLMAKAFAMRLMHLGLTVYVIGETITPSVTAGDALVAVSGSGTTPGTLRVAEGAAEAGATIFAVTTEPSSPLASLASRALIVQAATKWRREDGAKSEQPLGSLFDQCAHVVLDAVCLRLATRGGISNEAARGQHANVE
jgi:6-phospho-3-hexuloisomerase